MNPSIAPENLLPPQPGKGLQIQKNSTELGDNLNILSIPCFYHNSAACLVRDGKIVAAAQEERFIRKKHNPRFPENAIRSCLKEGGITAQS